MSTPSTWTRTVAEIEATTTRAGRASLGRCSLEGTRLFERALRSGAGIERAVVAEGFLSEENSRTQELLSQLLDHGCELQTVPDEVMQRLTQGRTIGAIVGLAELPTAQPLADLLSGAANASLILASVGNDDPGNVGALIRTCHASGGVAFSAAGTCDPFHPKAVRTSMGSVFRVPVYEFESATEMVTELRSRGVRTIGSVSQGGRRLDELTLTPRPTALLLGNEAFGLAETLAEGLDELVSIPMPGGVDSFSVNAAAAVLMYGLRGALRTG